jgi:hypothetical protein
MSTSSPEVTSPVTFPARFAWLQHTIKARVKPYHLVMAAALGLATVGFVVVIAVMILVATNFNVLGWTE